jgi:hypothetical protein
MKLWRLAAAVLVGLAGCAAPAAPTATPPGRPASTAAPAETLGPGPAPSATPAPAEAQASPTAPASLVPGIWHDMVYHERLGQVVLVNSGPLLGNVVGQNRPPDDPLDVWGWSGDGWELLSRDPAGPAWRLFAAVTYDAGRGVLVLYGGLQPPAQTFEDTWTWDGDTWTRHAVPGPGPREGPGLAYDSGRGRVVLFGGARGDEALGDTWEWDGAAWAQAAGDGPSPRFPGGFVYDAARGVTLLAGGHRVTPIRFETYGDTWTWDGAAWTEWTGDGPAPRDGARAIFDPQRGRVLLFGGIQIEPSVRFFADTWAWDSAAWTEVSAGGPPGRGHHALAYDPVRDEVLVYGGSDGPGPRLRGDTWRFNGEGWRCVAVCE